MKRSMIGGAILAAALFAGGVAVGQIGGIPGTSAAGPVVTSTSTPGQSNPTNSAAFPAHGSPAHEDAEKPVTGSAASQAQAAAVKYAGSAAAGAVTSDFRGDGYELTVTKSDGSTVEVHLDSTFAVQGDR